MRRNLYLHNGRTLADAIDRLACWTRDEVLARAGGPTPLTPGLRRVRIMVADRRRGRGRAIVRNLYLPRSYPLAAAIDSFRTYTFTRVVGTRIPMDCWRPIQVTVEDRTRRRKG